MMVSVSADEIRAQVRDIVFLLMKRPITEEIAMQVLETPGFEHLEIIDGDWAGFDEDEYVSGEQHGWIEALLVHAFTTWVLQEHAGRVYPGDTVFVLAGSPDDIQLRRRPDVAFVRNANVQPTTGFIYRSPDLAVEIISPTEKPVEIRQKLQDYLTHGVSQVWHVYPESRQVVVNYADWTARTYSAGDTISGSDLLPGFALEVAAIFA